MADSTTPQKPTVNSSDDGPPDGGSFDIEELTGDRRILTLYGRAMPYRPVSFETRHRVSTTAYGGFSQSTQQPLGAETGKTTVQGSWKNVYLSSPSGSKGPRSSGSTGIATLVSGVKGTPDDSAISSADTTTAAGLCDIVDDITRKGQLVKVSWAHLVRIGRLVKFIQKWLDANDCEWEIEFDFIGRDESLKTGTPPVPSVSDTSQQASKAYRDVDDATSFDSVPDLDQSFASAIDTHVSALQQGVLALDDTVRSRVVGITTDLDSTRRAIAGCQFVEDTASGLIDELTGRVAATAVAFDASSVSLGVGVTSFTVSPYRDLRGADPGQVVSAAIAMAQTAAAARRLKNVCGRQRIALAKASEANVIAVVMIKEEEDLRDLALRYYGTADGWTTIRKFNGFPGSQVDPGTVVLIPSSSAGSQ